MALYLPSAQVRLRVALALLVRDMAIPWPIFKSLDLMTTPELVFELC